MVNDEDTPPGGTPAKRIDAWMAAVPCRSWGEAMRTLRMAKEGLLVLRTSRPPAPGAGLRVKLTLPDGEEVALQGRALDVHFPDRQREGEVEARVRTSLHVDDALLERVETAAVAEGEATRPGTPLARGTAPAPGASSSTNTTEALEWRRKRRDE
jgi:hypothetical protein